jgi:hypothetical protein
VALESSVESKKNSSLADGSNELGDGNSVESYVSQPHLTRTSAYQQFFQMNNSLMASVKELMGSEVNDPESEGINLRMQFVILIAIV